MSSIHTGIGVSQVYGRLFYLLAVCVVVGTQVHMEAINKGPYFTAPPPITMLWYGQAWTGFDLRENQIKQQQQT